VELDQHHLSNPAEDGIPDVESPVESDAKVTLEEDLLVDPTLPSLSKRGPFSCAETPLREAWPLCGQGGGGY
jgi:hypothetical protein